MKIITNNKHATYQYHILEKYEAGIELLGSEVKSLRDGRVNLKDAFCKIENGEIFLYNAHISQYKNASVFNHDPERPRKLLMHKYEILKLDQKVKEKGLTIIPLKMYFNEKGLIKVEIALVKGKKLYDKREDIAKRDLERRIKKSIKYDM
ncbi:SsrA-binding protein SmpB [Marinitoga arctica]